MRNRTRLTRRSRPTNSVARAILGIFLVIGAVSLAGAVIDSESSGSHSTTEPSISWTSTASPKPTSTPRAVIPVCKDENVGNSTQRRAFLRATSFRKLSPTVYITYIDEPKGSGLANTAIVFNTDSCMFSLFVTQRPYSGPTSERPSTIQLVPATNKNLSKIYPIEWRRDAGEGTASYGKVCTTTWAPFIYTPKFDANTGVKRVAMTCPYESK